MQEVFSIFLEKNVSHIFRNFVANLEHFPAVRTISEEKALRHKPESLFAANKTDQPPKTLIMKPAAQAEPITPATLGPMACMSRKLAGFSFWPTV